ncbi:MAG: PIN domain-containing protein, partial [Pseudomonadota bacterium]|jgi:predicted nucleic acid-binding protein|nr:PIN domain-containing protein [Pseudomonadota bacterium]
MDAGDESHSRAKVIWKDIVESGDRLICNNYVLLETYSLIQHRFGMEAVSTFHSKVQPCLEVIWIDELLHKEAVNSMVIAGRRKLSLVDCTSFLSMRKLGIQTAFTFDKHFQEHGFTCL